MPDSLQWQEEAMRQEQRAEQAEVEARRWKAEASRLALALWDATPPSEDKVAALQIDTVMAEAERWMTHADDPSDIDGSDG